MKKISIKDVAQKAGVSTTLVSYVLNGKMTHRINPLTSEKIRQAAQELNYKPNSIAKSLKLQKTCTIGLIVADISNPFSAYLARIIEDDVQKLGYTLIIGSSDENPVKSQRLIETFLNRQVDGFIITPVAGSEQQIVRLLSDTVPVILLDRYFPDLPVSTITIDNYEVSYKATRHLIDTGCRSLAILTYNTPLLHLHDRVKGFADALEHSGLNDNLAGRIGVVETDERQYVEQAIGRFLSDLQADAIFFITNKLAIEGLKVLTEKRVKIPDELSVVAFDETDAYDLFYAPVTYIDQPLRRMGQKAVELLMAELDTATHNPVQLRFEASLIIRQSSARGTTLIR